MYKILVVDDEEKIRKAAKMINDKVSQYKAKYADKDIQDFLAMAGLQFVIRLLEVEDKSDDSQLLEKLHKLNDSINEILNTEKSNKDVLLHSIE
jgi:cell division protein ZapA